MADDGLDGVLFFLCPHDVISSQVKAVVPLDAKHQGTLNTVQTVYLLVDHLYDVSSMAEDCWHKKVIGFDTNSLSVEFTCNTSKCQYMCR